MRSTKHLMQYYNHKYPQNLWAKEINKSLEWLLSEVSETSKIVDAPCGNGIIAYFVKQKFKKRRVLAFDINEEIKKSTYLNNISCAPEYKVDDIFKKLVDGKDNIWLLINSLYCLPYKEKLLETHIDNYQYIIGVFPDIEADNYQYFVKQNPEFENPSAMTLDETEKFMHAKGYKLIKNLGITNLKFHIWNDKFVFRKLTPKMRNIVYTCLDKIWVFNKKQYAFMIFKRYE